MLKQITQVVIYKKINCNYYLKTKTCIVIEQ